MPPAVEGTTDESDAWAMSPCLPTRLHAQAGAILGLHPRLSAGARPAAGRSRFATILPGDAAFSPPDGAHARTQRPDPPSARHRSEHQGVGRSRSTAALTRQLRSTRQILCAELLVPPSQSLMAISLAARSPIRTLSRAADSLAV